MHHLHEHFDGKDHIIFDWNGTLLNDVDLCVEIIGSLLEDHGLPKLTRDDYRRIFRFPVKEYYVDIGFNFDKETFASLAEKFVTRYREKAPSCPLFEGAELLLAELKTQNKGRSILSAAHEDHLKELLSHHEIDAHFDHVFGLSDHYAASKIDRGFQLLERIGQPTDRIMMIGDTDHDIEVARALGIDILLLADGHQDWARLSGLHDKVVACRRTLPSKSLPKT